MKQLSDGMPATLSIVWDFDSALGQLNASYPYHFRRTPLEEELDAVRTLRETGSRLGVPMTFATVGAAAEEVPHPFAAHDELTSLHHDGHEIASHSWRHEWLPHLTTQQLRRSLLRSKVALEQVIGSPGSVSGFVPPFNRPMTWLARGEIRFGDRWALPAGAGATLDTLIPTVSAAGYTWIRAGYGRKFGRPAPDPLWPAELVAGCVNVPNHYNGFDQLAHELLDEAVQRRKLLVISGHPAGLFRHGNEHRDVVTRFLEAAARRRDRDELLIQTIGSTAAAMKDPS